MWKLREGSPVGTPSAGPCPCPPLSLPAGYSVYTLPEAPASEILLLELVSRCSWRALVSVLSRHKRSGVSWRFRKMLKCQTVVVACTLFLMLGNIKTLNAFSSSQDAK